MLPGILTCQIGEKQDILFDIPIISWVKSTIPGIQIFDFDNHSELFLIDCVKTQIGKLNKLAVVIKVHGMVDNVGPILRILSTLNKRDVELLIILDGNNDNIKKMCQKFAKDNFFSDIKYEGQQNIILNFAKK